MTSYEEGFSYQVKGRHSPSVRASLPEATRQRNQVFVPPHHLPCAASCLLGIGRKFMGCNVIHLILKNKTSRKQYMFFLDGSKLLAYVYQAFAMGLLVCTSLVFILIPRIRLYWFYFIDRKPEVW